MGSTSHSGYFMKISVFFSWMFSLTLICWASIEIMGSMNCIEYMNCILQEFDFCKFICKSSTIISKNNATNFQIYCTRVPLFPWILFKTWVWVEWFYTIPVPAVNRISVTATTTSGVIWLPFDRWPRRIWALNISIYQINKLFFCRTERLICEWKCTLTIHNANLGC